MPLDQQAVWSLLIAALGGAAIGMERQWSGHASGPAARFAGVRTFTLLGLFAGLSGVLWTAGFAWAAGILLAGAVGLILIAYLAASRVDVDGTTEVAAMMVLAAGLLAGLGNGRVAGGLFAGTALLLVEKSRLHSLVQKIPGTGLSAGARFAVLALVVLPLLPEGPYGPWGGLRPRELWMLVLFFSSLSFTGYIARGVAGPGRGYVLTGFLGGLISSTNVTWTFSKLSRREQGLAGPLALGVVAACTVMYFRVFTALLVLERRMAFDVLPYLAIPAAVGVGLVAFGLWRNPPSTDGDGSAENPLQLGAALQMALLFQAVLYAVYWAREWGGGTGLVASGAVLGLTDVDALTLSMARTVEDPAAPAALLAGVFANGVLKLGVTVTVGGGRFRRTAGAGLALLAVSSAAGLAFLAGR
ncbi:MAG: MgtC/SapB family protein [Bryobacteraceae bacterium]